MSLQSILTTGTCTTPRRYKAPSKHVTFNPITTSYGPVEHLSDIIPPPPPNPHTVEPLPYVDTCELRQYLVRLRFNRKHEATSTSAGADCDRCGNDTYTDAESNYSSEDQDDAQADPDLTEQQLLEHDWHTRGSPIPSFRMKRLGKKGRKEREDVVRRCHYAWQMERRRLDGMQQEWERLGREKDALEKRVREGLGRAEWELAIIQRRRMRQLGVEVVAGTGASPAVAGEQVDADDPMVDVGLGVAETAEIEDTEEVNSLEAVHRQYAAIDHQRKVLDAKSTNHAGNREDLLCEAKDRKRKRRDSDYCCE